VVKSIGGEPVKALKVMYPASLVPPAVFAEIACPAISDQACFDVDLAKSTLAAAMEPDQE
jgi:hypothetical protein